ncbi:MAG: 3-hydroxybutyryl-CoA dehydrogenase [Elusimicrobia bacterium]|nr:3-hydroxybutyryl-CoA dehydrogenase [Elusimicrobiota bacterium]
MEIKTIGIVGSGTMGSGIAQLAAQCGLEVRLCDVSDKLLTEAEARILRGLEKMEVPAAFSLIRKTTQVSSLKGCDFVVEAVSEDIVVKQGVFRQLDALLPPPLVLATNTSSLPIRKVAFSTENPKRIIGMHFFNPAPLMKLVEVIPHAETSADTIETVLSLARALGKTPVQCKDSPGFIANRLARPFYLRSMLLVSQGKATVTRVDQAIREGGFRMGPFELMDLIGLDVNLAITRVLFQGLGERFKPVPLQEKLVEMGHLGHKTSRGFYLYAGGRSNGENPMLSELIADKSSPADMATLLRQVLQDIYEEANRMVQEGVAPANDIDTAMKLGMNWPLGPFEWQKQNFRPVVKTKTP